MHSRFAFTKALLYNVRIIKGIIYESILLKGI